MSEVRIERLVEAPIDVVFEAWTSPAFMRRWWHAERDWETPIAEIDAQVGGEIVLVMRDPATGSEYGGRGAFTVLDPPRRLAFTWKWDMTQERAEAGLIDVELTEVGERTRIALTHSAIPDEEIADHRTGWDTSFDNLERAVAG